MVRKTSSEIRRSDPSTLRLPNCPKNLSTMTRAELLKSYDHFGDYWATWLGRAWMLPEGPSQFSNVQLRKIIHFVSTSWSRVGWKLDCWSDEGGAFYYNWIFDFQDAIHKRAKPRRSAKRSQR